MSNRATYHAQVTDFSVDVETDKDLINLSNVVDSDGELVADSMDLFHGSWSNNLDAPAQISFTAELTSRLKRQFIDGSWYNVRECYLCKPRLKT